MKKTKEFITEYYQQAGNRAKIADTQRKLLKNNSPYEVIKIIKNYQKILKNTLKYYKKNKKFY